MPADASVYSMFKPADLGEAFERGQRIRESRMKLSDLARQRENEDLYNETISKHVGPDGQLNPAVLSDLAKTGKFGTKAVELKGMMSEQAAREQKAKQEQFSKALPIVGGAMESLAKMSPQERAAQYPQVRSRLVKAGYIDPNLSPEEYDDNDFNQQFSELQSTKEWQDIKKTQAEIEKLKSEKNRGYRDPMAAFYERENYKEMRDQKLKEEELHTNYGTARTPDDAKQLKNAGELKSNFDRKLTEMIDLRKEYGGEAMNREAVARGKQLSSDLLLLYKDMAKLGVLSMSDEKILKSIIPDDPLQFNMSGMVGQDPTMHKLTKFSEDVNADFDTKISNRVRGGQAIAKRPGQDQGRVGEAGGNGSAYAGDRPPQGAASSGMVRMQGPDGAIRLIPEKLAGEAIAAGGKRIR